MAKPELVQQKIRLLRKARAYIRSGRNEFICTSLEDATTELGALACAQARNELQRYISKQLQGSYTYDDWLSRYYAGANVNPREGRLAWIDWMIKCYKEDYK